MAGGFAIDSVFVHVHSATAQACADTNILVKSTRRKHRSQEFVQDTEALFILL